MLCSVLGLGVRWGWGAGKIGRWGSFCPLVCELPPWELSAEVAQHGVGCQPDSGSTVHRGAQPGFGVQWGEGPTAACGSGETLWWKVGNS